MTEQFMQQDPQTAVIVLSGQMPFIEVYELFFKLHFEMVPALAIGLVEGDYGGVFSINELETVLEITLDIEDCILHFDMLGYHQKHNFTQDWKFHTIERIIKNIINKHLPNFVSIVMLNELYRIASHTRAHKSQLNLFE